MPEHTQAGRPMRVDTALEEDELLLQSFSGLEGISIPFSFRLHLLSENNSVSATDLLRTGMRLSVELEDGEVRFIHGIVNRFVAGNEGEDGLRSYEAEIIPGLWFLSLSRDCKIFQKKSVLEIVEEVFTEQGLTDFENRCTTSYPKREYCVQYRETHLNFVSRLLEEEGIFYFFEHTETGHVLILADDNSALQPCPSKPTAPIRSEEIPEEDVVTGLREEHAVHVGTVSLQDYDFEQPAMNLFSTMSGEEQQEIYDYHPRRYTELEEGERYARLQLEVLEAGRQIVYGDGNCRAFTSGYRFDLEDHFSPPLNQAYVLVQVSHNAHAGDYHSASGTGMDYRNSFLAIPHDVPFRPQRAHAKPLVRGSQTAIVVGPSGEEIYTDNYGRVKVQFYWDRVGERNEHSSCWIRVATPWGGKGYGSVSIPRIDNEVIVEFLEGDPDRPLIVGSVYNADQMPPTGLPGAGIQMGMKSRSSPGGGGHNEITLTDTANEEVMTVHAQRDRNLTVLNDETITVEGNRTIRVHGDTGQKVTIEPGTSETNVEGNSSLTSASGDITIQAAAAGVKIDAKTRAHVLGQADVLIERDGGHCIEVMGGSILLTCGGSIVFMEDSQITLTSTTIALEGAGGTITIDGSGIAIEGSAVKVKGSTVNVEASGQTEIKGAPVKVN